MSYAGTASSPGTNSAVNILSTDVINTNITGEVTLTSATAILDSQNFDTSGIIEIDDNEFVLEFSGALCGNSQWIIEFHTNQ